MGDANRPPGDGTTETGQEGLIQPRDDGQLHFAPGTEGATFPVIACVIAADLHTVGQLRPGDTVRFTIVDRKTAHTALLHRERALDTRVTGWFPTAAGT